MTAGKLDRRIILQRFSGAVNAFNEIEEVWSDLVTRWAMVSPISDAERVRAGAVSATITTRFKIRYSTQVADLNPKDRVSFEGKIFDIWGVKEIGRREYLEISASARAD